MHKRFLSFVSLLAILALVLTGCSAAATPQPAQPTAAPAVVPTTAPAAQPTASQPSSQPIFMNVNDEQT